MRSQRLSSIMKSKHRPCSLTALMCVPCSKECLKAQQLPDLPCPLRGCRAVDLARGTEHIMKEISSGPDARAHILQHCPNCSPDDVAPAVKDFYLGITRFQLLLSEKLRCWSALPWRLSLIAQVHEESARTAARTAVTEYDNTKMPQAQGQDTDSIIHHLTVKYLSKGGVVRSALDQFIAGKERQDLPALLELCAAYRFLPCCERQQEGDHAVISLRAARRTVSGSYVSLEIRMGEIVTLMQHAITARGPAQNFLLCVDKLRNPSNIAAFIKCEEHPLWQEALADAHSSKKDLRGKMFKLLNAIMYAADPETQYLQLEKVAKAGEKKRRRQKKTRALWLEQFGKHMEEGSGARGNKTQQALHQGAINHLHMHLIPGPLYSLPKETPSYAISEVTGPPIIQDNKRRRLSVVVESMDSNSRASVGVSQEVNEWCSNNVFFRVLHLKLGQAKALGTSMGKGSDTSVLAAQPFSD